VEHEDGLLDGVGIGLHAFLDLEAAFDEGVDVEVLENEAKLREGART
jgi:hypothetical protein